RQGDGSCNDQNHYHGSNKVKTGGSHESISRTESEIPYYNFVILGRSVQGFTRSKRECSTLETQPFAAQARPGCILGQVKLRLVGALKGFLQGADGCDCTGCRLEQVKSGRDNPLGPLRL